MSVPLIACVFLVQSLVITEFEQVEIRRTYFPSGAAMLEYEVLFDDAGREAYHGAFRKWFENGQPDWFGFYKRGQLYGLGTKWYSNGILESRSEWKNGVQEGYASYWFENGQRRSQGTMTAGQPHGIWHWWNPDGTRLAIGEYRSGRPINRWACYSLEGKLEFLRFYDYLNGRFTEHFSNGVMHVIGRMDSQGRSEGDWTWWHPNGQVAVEGHFRGNERIGRWVFYNDRGEVTADHDYGQVDLPWATGSGPSPTSR